MIRRQLRPGDAFGETAVLTARPTRSRVVAGEACVLAQITKAQLDKAMAGSTAFRRALLAEHRPELEALHASAAEKDGNYLELLVITCPPHWPLGKLTTALGEALEVNHGDRIGVIHVTDTEPPKYTEVPHPGADGLVRLDAGPNPDGFIDSEFATKLRREVDYLLVDLEQANSEVSAVWTAHATKVVTLNLPGQHTKIRGLSDAATLCESILMPDESVYPLVLPAGAARLRLNRHDLGKPLAQWSAKGRLALDKWARHVSDRTVGIALGGGGAWGYAHVALLEELIANKIPIDIVAGVSFGAMVGAYYCAKGEEGLRILQASGPRLAKIVHFAAINSWVIGTQVKRDVGEHWLEDLDTVFVPVACDIAAAETTAIRGAYLTIGVRASGSFPTVFAPTTVMDTTANKLRRYVDGGISDNVPDGPILAEGADLVIASNIVPPPTAVPASKPMLPGRIGSALHALNPLQRMNDGFRSTFMLFHTAGNSERLAVDAVLHTKPTGHLPVAFEAYKAIMDESRPLAKITADQALDRWKAMQGRRKAD